MKREIGDPTKCFKLTCYHLMNHSYLANPSASLDDLLTKMAEKLSIIDVDENSVMIYRVFYKLIYHVPSYIHRLVDTIIRILSINPDDLKKPVKKGFFGKETVNYKLYLVREVLFSLVDLPDFQNTANMIIGNSDFETKLFNLYGFNYLEDKVLLLAFFGRINNLPASYLKIEDESYYDHIQCIKYYLKKHEKFFQIIIDKSKKDQASYNVFCKQYIMNGHKNSRALVDTFNFNGDLSFTTLIPVFSLLKSDLSYCIPQSLSKKLFLAFNETNVTLSIFAFSILCQFLTEKEWIIQCYRSLLTRISHETMKGLMRTIFQSWDLMIQRGGIFLEQAIELIRITFEEFPKGLPIKYLEEFLLFETIKKHADKIVAIFTNSIRSLPQDEGFVLILISAKRLFSLVSESTVSQFKASCKNYLERADPAMLTIYETVME